jgi:hypothetical protein
VRARSPLITAGRCSPKANFRPVATTLAKYVRPDGFLAAQQPPLAAVNDGMGVVKGHHSLDVSRALAGDQQPLEILWITR